MENDVDEDTGNKAQKASKEPGIEDSTKGAKRKLGEDQDESGKDAPKPAVGAEDDSSSDTNSLEADDAEQRPRKKSKTNDKVEALVEEDAEGAVED